MRVYLEWVVGEFWLFFRRAWGSRLYFACIRKTYRRILLRGPKIGGGGGAPEMGAVDISMWFLLLTLAKWWEGGRTTGLVGEVVDKVERWW